MFALPQMLEIPGLTIAGGIMEWPWLGALFAWLLVAALVGSALALLRDYTGGVARQHTRASCSVGPHAD
ncbi:MAG: hypothetical protein ACE5I7_11110 [Candidatus Binatia bacterium]